ncbi:AAA family ATPase [Adlercreutzia sp. R7]|uniref:AAA family ATPase n=1 Tax=Adlercreutzia wanghongyangiae TaxID=3111451 RepID=A0ABU6IEM3_9ACTN|nr:AAA family ATPase [Adlercreutzia sp. R7]
MGTRDTIFAPSFGNRPSMLVGRDGLIDRIVEGLSSAPGSRDRAVLLLGQRGSGKTVLLWELADRMRKAGFVVANPTIVSEDLLPRIVEKLADDADFSPKRRASGGSVGALGFSAGLQFQQAPESGKSRQQQLTELCRELTDKGKGVLFLIDELQANSLELKQLVITYQELVGEGLNVALVMAGLPGAVSATLNDKVLTFLNRAPKIALSPLEFGDVDAFYRQSFDQLGLNIASDLRRHAAGFTAGSPYMLQLVGHNVVRYALPDGEVDESCLADALATSQIDFENDICRTTLAALSEKDIEFLSALAQDGEEASMADIAERMLVTPDYAQKYRKRLIDSGIIEAAGRGRVRMAVPYLANHLRKELDCSPCAQVSPTLRRE